jgi:hypothetical protein
MPLHVLDDRHTPVTPPAVQLPYVVGVVPPVVDRLVFTVPVQQLLYYTRQTDQAQSYT